MPAAAYDIKIVPSGYFPPFGGVTGVALIVYFLLLTPPLRLKLGGGGRRTFINLIICLLT